MIGTDDDIKNLQNNLCQLSDRTKRIEEHMSQKTASSIPQRKILEMVEYKEFISKIKKLMKKKRFSNALKTMNTNKEKYSEIADYWVNLGLLNYRKGNYDSAISSYNKGNEIDTTDYCIPCHIAFCLVRQGKYQDAKNSLNQVLRLRPITHCNALIDLFQIVYAKIGTKEDVLNLLTIYEKKSIHHCNKCLIASLFYIVKDYKSAYDLIENLTECENGYLDLLRITLKGHILGKEDAIKELLSISFKNTQFYDSSIGIIRDLSQFCVSIKKLDYLPKIKQNIVEKIRFPHIAPKGIILESIAGIALSADYDAIFCHKTLKEANKYHDCAILRRYYIMSLLRLDYSKQLAKYCKQTIRSKDYIKQSLLWFPLGMAFALLKDHRNFKLVLTNINIFEAENLEEICILLRIAFQNDEKEIAKELATKISVISAKSNKNLSKKFQKLINNIISQE